MRTLLLHVTTVPMSLTFLRGQVGHMQARGLRVHVLSSGGPELFEFGRTEHVAVHPVAMRRSITPFRDLAAIIRILRIMRAVRPAIVHSHTPKGGLLGMVAAAIHGTPVRIYHARGFPYMSARGARRALLWATEWLACRIAHRVLCVSHSLRREAIESGVCPAGKIYVLMNGSGNGVDAAGRFVPHSAAAAGRCSVRERFGIASDATVIGFVGRVVRDKGVVELAEAWQTLRARYRRLHLLIVGPLEPHDPLPRATEAMLRNDPRVHLAGADWDTPPLYAAMDIVAQPSYREGFPNVPLEAAAMGVPVVATRIPGCVDAVADGVTGRLVEPRDSAALARALARYVEDPALRSLHGQAGRSRVLQDFSPESLWAALYEEYRRLLAERLAGHPAAAQPETNLAAVTPLSMRGQ